MHAQYYAELSFVLFGQNHTVFPHKQSVCHGHTWFTAATVFTFSSSHTLGRCFSWACCCPRVSHLINHGALIPEHVKNVLQMCCLSFSESDVDRIMIVKIHGRNWPFTSFVWPSTPAKHSDLISSLWWKDTNTRSTALSQAWRFGDIYLSNFASTMCWHMTACWKVHFMMPPQGKLCILHFTILGIFNLWQKRVRLYTFNGFWNQASSSQWKGFWHLRCSYTYLLKLTKQVCEDWLFQTTVSQTPSPRHHAKLQLLKSFPDRHES